MKAIIVIAGFLALLTGCSGLGKTADLTPTQRAEQAAIARAEARWKSMIAKDLDAAYGYLSPGSKSTNPLSMFKAKIRLLSWKSATGISADCSEDQCRIKLRISLHDTRLGGDVETVVEEVWLKSSGEWWLVFNH